MMKRIFALLIGIATTVSMLAVAPTIEEADQMALEGRYVDASTAYEMILQEGNESAELYYNLGYAYFKQGMLGKAIINFERSQRLNPSDADVRVNLEQAYALTDKMQIVEPLIFAVLWQDLKNAMSSDGWAMTFVLLFALGVAGVCCFLFLDSVAMRKAGFFSAIALFALSVFAVSFSAEKRSEILESAEGIIMVSSTNLLTSPDKNGSQMAVLHEGTHVTIVDTLGDWIEVRLRDGNIGWMKMTDVERI